MSVKLNIQTPTYTVEDSNLDNPVTIAQVTLSIMENHSSYSVVEAYHMKNSILLSQEF